MHDALIDAVTALKKRNKGIKIAIVKFLLENKTGTTKEICWGVGLPYFTHLRPTLAQSQASAKSRAILLSLEKSGIVEMLENVEYNITLGNDWVRGNHGRHVWRINPALLTPKTEEQDAVHQPT